MLSIINRAKNPTNRGTKAGQIGEMGPQLGAGGGLGNRQHLSSHRMQAERFAPRPAQHEQ